MSVNEKLTKFNSWLRDKVVDPLKKVVSRKSSRASRTMDGVTPDQLTNTTGGEDVNATGTPEVYDTTVTPTDYTTTVERDTTVALNGTDDQETNPLLIGGGIGAGVLLVLCMISVIVFIYCRKQKGKRKKIPPVLPDPKRLTTQLTYLTDEGVHYSKKGDNGHRLSSTSASEVQVLGYTPTRMSPHQTSIPTNNAPGPPLYESADKHNHIHSGSNSKIVPDEKCLSSENNESVYVNDQAVSVSHNSEHELSRDSLYVRPESWQGFHSAHQSYKEEEEEEEEEEQEDVASGDIGERNLISRSRLDSQKYLLPAELVLQIPRSNRKVSEPSLSRPQPLTNNGSMTLKWKAAPPIVHTEGADTDRTNSTNSLYVAMDNPEQENDPLNINKECSPNTKIKSNRKCSRPVETSDRPPPPPCKPKREQNEYINVPGDNQTSPKPQSPTSPRLYEDVSAAFVFQTETDIYENAEEIQKGGDNAVTNIKTNKNEITDDTYRVFSVTKASDIETQHKKHLIIIPNSNSEPNAFKPRNDTPDAEIVSSFEVEDQSSSELEENETGGTFYYVNVGEFQKVSADENRTQISKNSYVTGIIQCKEEREVKTEIEETIISETSTKSEQPNQVTAQTKPNTRTRPTITPKPALKNNNEAKHSPTKLSKPTFKPTSATKVLNPPNEKSEPVLTRNEVTVATSPSHSTPAHLLSKLNIRPSLLKKTRTNLFAGKISNENSQSGANLTSPSPKSHRKNKVPILPRLKTLDTKPDITEFSKSTPQDP